MNIPKPEFPRPDKERRNWLNLNGEWDFRLFKEGSEELEKNFFAQNRTYTDKILVPFSWGSPLSGIEQDYPGVGWYRRSAAFETADRVFICFGAVDYIADVYINGKHAGHHQGGYTQFEFDITELWHTGENIIEVRAEDYRNNYQTRGKQSYGECQGIWQTVWLEARPASYMDNIRFTTKCSGDITLEAEIILAEPENVTLKAEFDHKCYKTEAELPAGRHNLNLSFNIPEPKLWSPDDPYLYYGNISLETRNSTDTIYTYFGIREIGVKSFGDRSYTWVTLNNKPVYLNGTLDQAFNPKGYFTYPSDKDMRDEAWRLKRLGLNMVRIHIKPEEPRKLYWMDKLGVLVMADMPCFMGEPSHKARSAYESEWPDVIKRDINHPSIFSWVMFNETWGLFSDDNGKRLYKPETQAWVRNIYKRAKMMDPTRLVEDNSPCNYDHVETDINTWHFYINGYEQVRDHIRKVADNTYEGSPFNYVKGCRQKSAPLMNSECGMVWGVEGSAGDSDISWQYHYMLNEFRLHEKNCGFVFTEFHDVVNEFNGYYRIDDNDKDFGYQYFCRGMTLRDLHSTDFIAIDAPPCRTIKAGEAVAVPLVLSSFSDRNHGKVLTLNWELWHDGLDGRISDMKGEMQVRPVDYGTTPLDHIDIIMPQENALAVLSLYLMDDNGSVISRNFITFDVRSDLPDNIITVSPEKGIAEGFDPVWQALGGHKANFGGSGRVTYKIDIKDTDLKSVNNMTIYFEAGAKRLLTKDLVKEETPKNPLAYFITKNIDRGRFNNSYFMTDNDKVSSFIDVYINGIFVETIYLDNDPADSRGVLSWHYQPDNRRLDEAGSYGELKQIEVPSRLIPQIIEEKQLELTFSVKGDGGLALYGRNSGRYPIDIVVRIR